MGRAERRGAAALYRRSGWTPFERGPIPDLAAWPALGKVVSTWSNSLYAVIVFEHVTDIGLVYQLQVQRHDMQPIRSWSDMQRIKNEILGPDRLAVEVYPPEAELVDQAHAYHLWAFPPGHRLPFGLERRSG